MIDKRKMGKRSRAQGKAFENKYSLANKERWLDPEYSKG